MTDHDGSYKHIFFHAYVVEDLLRGFVHEDWMAELDFSSLERVNGSYVTDDLRTRSGDLVWRVQCAGSLVLHLLLIEFPSREIAGPGTRFLAPGVYSLDQPLDLTSLYSGRITGYAGFAGGKHHDRRTN